MGAKATDSRVKVTRFNSTSLPLFELLDTIVKFPTDSVLYLRFYIISCNNIHGFQHVQGALDTRGIICGQWNPVNTDRLIRTHVSIDLE